MLPKRIGLGAFFGHAFHAGLGKYGRTANNLYFLFLPDWELRGNSFKIGVDIALATLLLIELALVPILLVLCFLKKRRFEYVRIGLHTRPTFTILELCSGLPATVRLDKVLLLVKRILKLT